MIKNFILNNGLTESSVDEIITRLNEKNIHIVDSTLRGMTTIAHILSDEEMEIVARTLDAICQQSYAMREYRECLRSNAVDFSLDKMQAQITTLGTIGSWPSDLTTKIKELGVKIYSYAEQNSLTVTTETVQAALDDIALDTLKGELQGFLADRYNTVHEMVYRGELLTIDAIKGALSS